MPLYTVLTVSKIFKEKLWKYVVLIAINYLAGIIFREQNVLHLMYCCFLAIGTMEEPKWTGTMAKQYPFTLDPFQSTSVACLVS